MAELMMRRANNRLLALGLVAAGLWLAAPLAAQQDQSDRRDRSAAQQATGASSDQNAQERQRSGQSRSDFGRTETNQYRNDPSRSDQFRGERQQDQSFDRQASDRRFTDRQTDRQSGDRQGDRGSSRGNAWLGVYLSEDQNQQNGAQVTHIYPAGPAARAGLRPGDVITAVNGQRIRSSSDLMSAIEQEQAGSRTQLTVTRNNQPMNVAVILGDRDAFVFRGQGDGWGGQPWGGQPWSGQSGQSGHSGQASQFDPYANMPPFAMQLEHERRMYEQHQRIEEQIAKLHEEVRQLREMLQRR
jgi:hypothetical protein